MVSAEKIAQFRERVEAVRQTYGEDLVFNMDETNFRLVNMKHLTWALTGSKAVTCYNEEDVKLGVTVLATVSMSNEKLPLMLVGKGKTDACLKKYGRHVNDRTFWTAVSESGWTRENVMIRYLENLSEHVDGKPCALILDVYKAHRTDMVKQKAQQLGIELVFIPPGCTDQCQPLDISVFAVLKAHAKALRREYYHANLGRKVEWTLLMDHLLESWEKYPEV